jgi:hypothetical protein
LDLLLYQSLLSVRQIATAFASVAALMYLAEIGHEQQGAINKRMR